MEYVFIAYLFIMGTGEMHSRLSYDTWETCEQGREALVPGIGKAVNDKVILLGVSDCEPVIVLGG